VSDHQSVNQPLLDALLPPEILERAVVVGVAKANMPTARLVSLGILGGAFIAFGAMFSTVVTSDPGSLGSGFSRLIGGVVFALGLVLVVIGGAELFTGNNLLMIAFAEGRVTWRALLRNWSIVYVANLVGAVGVAALIFATRQYQSGSGLIGLRMLAIAETKSSGGVGSTIASGVAANCLVCLAIWMSYGGRSVIDKVIVIVFPVSAFVAAGFEHSIANLYLLPTGWMVKNWGTGENFGDASGAAVEHLHFSNMLMNVVAATVGNIIGGGLLVGLVYWFAYKRPNRAEPS
jgi:formate transporter